MNNFSHHKGFSLVELMTAVAILAVVSAIAIPAYLSYIREAELGTARVNADSLRIFLEDWRLDNGSYQVGGSASFNPETSAQLGWVPEGDRDLYSYAVVGATANDYTVVVTYTATGRWLRCEDRMNQCCDGTGAVTACP